jgi:hypothetical protein
MLIKNHFYEIGDYYTMLKNYLVWKIGKIKESAVKIQ